VIHATATLQQTLSNLRALLKSRGIILMQEGSQQDFLWPLLAFGQLPGWWPGTESTRELCPFLSASKRDMSLRQFSFSGVDIQLPGSRYPDLCSQSLFISSAVNKNHKGNPFRKAVLMKPNSSTENGPLTSLKKSLLEKVGVAGVSIIQIRDLCSSNTTTNSACISFLELSDPFHRDATEEEYLAIRQSLVTCGGLL
jgi:hypothetical protein